MHNPEEDFVGFFLGFVGVFPQSGQKLFENWVIQRSSLIGGKGVTMRTKEIIAVKGPLDFPQDVAGNGLQVVVTKPVKGAKKARGNRSSVPAWRG